MVLEVKWAGIDFGQCLLSGSRERTYWMIGDACKELGEPEFIEERCHKWRLMKEKYGTWSAIKEKRRPEIVTYVFDDRPAAKDVFPLVERKYFSLADGAVDALKYLVDQGIEVSMVAEHRRTLGPIGTDETTRFLQSSKIIKYFTELITPQGKVNLRDGAIDLKYKGSSKETESGGTMYDILAAELLARGIKPSEAVMLGDKEWSDITPAQKRGFKTIHYIGYLLTGPSNADYTIRHFSELKGIVKGV
jgi:FMN phosphatase YigB (HAD superfamily)